MKTLKTIYYVIMIEIALWKLRRSVRKITKIIEQRKLKEQSSFVS